MNVKAPSKSPAAIAATLLKKMGVPATDYTHGKLLVYSPIDGQEIGRITPDTMAQVEQKIQSAHKAFLEWRVIPAPKRGELIRLFAQELRLYKQDLGTLISLETGKILSEGTGEVQEMIDICDFAVGLSRQLYGLTIASERPAHAMREVWQPLGAIGVITAFNFPAAVWAWNFCIALVCGDSVVWKPSEKTPLTALACQALFAKATKKFGATPKGLCTLCFGDHKVGEKIADHKLLPLISATGSTRMGKMVGPRVAQRFGRSILELGGNNAMILTPSADLNLALRATLFGSVGTAGQRCTTQRRLLIHESIADTFIESLKKAYASVSIGHPLASDTLMGPLIDKNSYRLMQQALRQARSEGGEVIGGKRVLQNDFPKAYYVTPALAVMPKQTSVVCQETFAPILYIVRYKKFEEAIALNNAVPQGLSSCLFTNDLKQAEIFLSAAGSDCGIANINLGTSGAEIGGAFGGEKETGGGREAGSDSWKAYMRRATCTVNFGDDLPLAQGVRFDLDA